MDLNLKHRRVVKQSCQSQKKPDKSANHIDYQKLNKQCNGNLYSRVWNEIDSTYKRKIVQKTKHYEKKYNLQRAEFLKIYVFYIALCFQSSYKLV
mmetsp:Transcript_15704/g.15183  ORF Transcript_15704/g.15183 Transcript_15704/m.15183 type:complete len:95 (+) Transcript_15704:315-599(+)